MMENRKHILREYGLRVTEARLMVLDAFLHSFRIFDHHTLLVACGGRVDRVTLYRTLHIFFEQGILYKVPTPEGGVRYGLRGLNGKPSGKQAAGEDHLHLVCEDCGKIISVAPVRFPAIPVPKEFQATHVDMIVNGKCAACAGEQGPQRKRNARDKGDLA